jgi:NAD(P)-dependent dehydrogenase (short-subunit alcohol dehydrogenase family)
MSPSSKTIIITGATSGIGLALAHQLLIQGCNVIGIGRSTERCQQAQRALSNVNPHTHLTYLLADLSLQVQIHKLAGQIKQQLASWQIAYLDGLVNNAATCRFTRPSRWRVMILNGRELSIWILTDQSAVTLYGLCSCCAHCFRKFRFPLPYRMHWHDLQLFHSYNPLRAYNIPNWHRCYSSMN